MIASFALLVRAFIEVFVRRLSRGPLLPSRSFVFEVVLRFMRLDWDAATTWSFQRLRATADARPYPRPFARRVRTRDEVLGGVPAVRFEVDGERARGVVLYLHGGSFVFGSMRTTHEDFAARLATWSRTTVVGIDYRLAPEHVYPAALEDAMASFDALVGSGIPAAGIVLAGDSAGGNLALALQIALRDRDGTCVAGLALMSPWCDLTMPGESYRSNEPLDFGTREGLDREARAYVGSIPLGDARVSPAYASLQDLPSVFIAFGTAELLRDDIVVLAERLQQASVPVTLCAAADMPHNPGLFADFHPEGVRAARTMSDFIVQRLSR
jgi:monoterpene epsilon-lactone hydrolase